MKAATILSSSVSCVAVISIHAAREGGDKLTDIDKNSVSISIHAAREGGDHDMPAYDTHGSISIHAAREGGDQGNLFRVGFFRYFNPRRP